MLESYENSLILGIRLTFQLILLLDICSQITSFFAVLEIKKKTNELWVTTTADAC